MTWNGVAWFLSALVFCYFCTPCLLRMLRKVKSVFQMLIALAALFAARLALYYLLGLMTGFWMYFYIFPVCRMFDYAMGCVAGFWFLHREASATPIFFFNRIFSTAIEFGILAIWLLECYINEQYFVWVQVLAIVVLAFEAGGISRLLQTPPMQYLGGFGMELFLLHQPLIPYVGIINQKVIRIPLNFKAVLMVALDIAVAVGFKQVISRWKRMKEKV